MNIALDVDGVLADVIVSWIEQNNKIRKPLLKQDIISWDFWKTLKIDRFQFFDELATCWKNWIDIPTTEENLSNTTRMLSEIARVDIVTAREKSTNQYVKNWLELHEISYTNYVSVAAGSMKANLNYDVFIDDSPLNALEFLRNKKKMLLYSQPWNRNLNNQEIHRISNLSEAVELLNSKYRL